jgi:hypothetical protein
MRGPRANPPKKTAAQRILPKDGIRYENIFGVGFLIRRILL